MNVRPDQQLPPGEENVTPDDIAATREKLGAPRLDAPGDAIHDLIAKAMRDNRVRVVASMPNCSHGRAASAVRVRFVDLPPVYREVAGPFGIIPAAIAEPGGFALVVDRFRDAGHRGSELARWELFGQAIGARTVLCYPGELDIVDAYRE